VLLLVIAGARMLTSRSPAPPRERVPSRAVSRDVLPTAGEALDVVDDVRRAYETHDRALLKRLLTAEAATSTPFPERLDGVAYLQPLARVEPRGHAMEVRAPYVIRYREGDATSELRGTAVWRIARRDGTLQVVGWSREPATPP